MAVEYQYHQHRTFSLLCDNDRRRSMSDRLPRFDWLDLPPVQPHQVRLMENEPGLVQT